MNPTNYIAFLRAINVSGRVVKMDRLRDLFWHMGFSNVRSYIQTGNVFFETPQEDRTVLARGLEQSLLDDLGFEVGVMLRTVPELERSMNTEPFRSVEITPDTRLVVTFTSHPLPKDLELPHRPANQNFEIVRTTEGEAFVAMSIVNGRGGNPNQYIEKAFKVRATSRFFGTTAKILEAARAASASPKNNSSNSLPGSPGGTTRD